MLWCHSASEERYNDPGPVDLFKECHLTPPFVIFGEHLLWRPYFVDRSRNNIVGLGLEYFCTGGRGDTYTRVFPGNIFLLEGRGVGGRGNFPL